MNWLCEGDDGFSEVGFQRAFFPREKAAARARLPEITIVSESKSPVVAMRAQMRVDLASTFPLSVAETAALGLIPSISDSELADTADFGMVSEKRRPNSAPTSRAPTPYEVSESVTADSLIAAHEWIADHYDKFVRSRDATTKFTAGHASGFVVVIEGGVFVVAYEYVCAYDTHASRLASNYAEHQPSPKTDAERLRDGIAIARYAVRFPLLVVEGATAYLTLVNHKPSVDTTAVSRAHHTCQREAISALFERANSMTSHFVPARDETISEGPLGECDAPSPHPIYAQLCSLALAAIGIGFEYLIPPCQPRTQTVITVVDRPDGASDTRVVAENIGRQCGPRHVAVAYDLTAHNIEQRRAVVELRLPNGAPRSRDVSWSTSPGTPEGVSARSSDSATSLRARFSRRFGAGKKPS